MNREEERQQSLRHIIEEYLSKLTMMGLSQEDLLRDYSMSAELEPEIFLDEVNKLREMMV